jgi:hypothetical protein
MQFRFILKVGQNRAIGHRKLIEYKKTWGLFGTLIYLNSQFEGLSSILLDTIEN